MASVLFTKLAMTRGRDEVYVVAVPLRATKGPAQLVMSAAYSLNLWDLQHFMVLIKPSSPPPSSQALVFDFNLKILKIYLLLLRLYLVKQYQDQRITVRSSSYEKVEKTTKKQMLVCWTSEVDAVDVACKFNKSWETNLTVGHHDCRDYTKGLVEYLTGQKKCIGALEKKQRWFELILQLARLSVHT